AALADRLRETAARDAARELPDDTEESNWPYNYTERGESKKAWWRTLGRDRTKRGDKHGKNDGE
ncbi:MAG: hypothetical protein UHD09_01595, partial [Bifidobacterium sp.]|nr:hypothetical protein [Bifidobacterium sp.]